MKQLLFFILMLITVYTALAQNTQTVKIKPGGLKAQPVALTYELQKALNENFKMSSPTESNDLSKPLRIAGYGVPGAKVEIHITPISKGGSSKPVLVAHGKQSPYDVQNYFVTVGSSGSWSLSEAVSVKFRDGASQRRVHVFAGQSKDGAVGRNPVNRELKMPDELKAVIVKIKQPLTITSHEDGQLAAGGIQVLGTGQPGLKIEVNLYAFASVTSKTSIWETFKTVVSPTTPIDIISGNMKKKGSAVKEKLYKTYRVTIDNNGKWYIPVFQSFGYTEWMRNAFIPFAWVISAQAEDPNYREGNLVRIKLRCR